MNPSQKDSYNPLFLMLKRQSSTKLSIYCAISTILLGVVDYFTGHEISFAIFYVAPIAIAAYFINKPVAIMISILSSVAWLCAHHFARTTSLGIPIYIWNASTRLGFFLIITMMLTTIRKAYEDEREFSRTDHLTGAANSRLFYEFSNDELSKIKISNKPFSLAHIDVDHFKQVNDTLGHQVGDILLKQISKTIQENIRKTDLLARLGGDEFAIFLTDTNQELAEKILQKIQTKLMQMVSQNNYPVSFSIGMITCHNSPDSIDTVLKEADDLMYAVKANGKNNILHKSR